MRDAQRERVYTAEHDVGVYTDNPPGLHFTTVPEMQAYVDKLTRSAWWRKNVRRPLSIEVQDGRRRRRANGGQHWDGSGYVKMPRPHRNEAMLLHEVAHTIVPHDHHGARWAGVYLGLLDRQLGREAAEAQMAAFRERNVDWTLPAWWRRRR